MSALPANVPAVGRPRPFRMPPAEDVTLRNGLRVVALRRSTVPRIEVRLRVPAGLIFDRGDAVRARLMSETLLTGTSDKTAVDLARDLQRLGASLEAGAGSDDLNVGGGVLSSNLAAFLQLMAETVTEPAFPTDEVAVARDRIAQEIVIRRSQPAGIASEMLSRRLFGRHPYGRGLPSPDAVKRTGAAPLRTYHAERMLPRGATLVLVGDLQPAKAIERAHEAFGHWKGKPSGPQPGAPVLNTAGLPTVIVDRPGAVQTNVRVAGPAVPRRDPGFLSLSVANLIYGGYFSSRLVKNIREDKGYTYSPNSSFDHRRYSSTFVSSADVGSDVTAPSLVEIRYELGRMASLPPKPEELAAAKRYLSGVTMLSLQTQAGLAANLAGLVVADLPLDYFTTFAAAVDAVTAEQVQHAGVRFLSPKNLMTLLVGDASAIRAGVEALDEVEVVASP